VGFGKRLGLLFLVGVVAAAVTASTALAGGGNSDNAKLCQGWRMLSRTDGTAFRNKGACLSYAARGGAPKATATAPHLGYAQGGCPPTGDFSITDTCFYLSGAGLKAESGIFDLMFELVDPLDGDLVSAVAYPTANADGVIEPTPVLGLSGCGGSFGLSVTYFTGQDEPITATVVFDIPDCTAGAE
jgi:hypothetical protein